MKNVPDLKKFKGRTLANNNVYNPRKWIDLYIEEVLPLFDEDRVYPKILTSNVTKYEN